MFFIVKILVTQVGDRSESQELGIPGLRDGSSCVQVLRYSNKDSHLV